MTELIKKGKYKHFKGNYYEVIDVAAHHDTQEPWVIYKPLYELPEGKLKLAVRPMAMFLEEVDRDGYKGPRFAYVGDMEKD